MPTLDANLRSFVAQFWKLDLDAIHDGLKFTGTSLKGMSSTRFLVFVTAVETNFGARLNDPAAITDYQALRRLVAGQAGADPATGGAPAQALVSPPPTRATTRSILPSDAALALESFGLGHDIEEVRSLPEATDYLTASFYTKTFTATEIAYCAKMASPRQHFAARIAAKEALYKSSPLFRDLNHGEIEVVNDESGRPHLNILNESVRNALGPCSLLVSLSHTDSLASATVMLVRLR